MRMKLYALSEWPSLLRRHLASAKRPCIAVVGPTASGKTAFSVTLAREISRIGAEGGWEGAEIVNADSRQLYRHLDIGTAKVTEQEKDGVPHHLFSVLDPSEEVTIAWYKEHATKAIEDILSRRRIPIVVGGSMLYVSAVIDGLEPLPPVDPSLRKRLEAEYEADQGKTLYAKLMEIDPETASAFHPNNKPYVIRAMEMLEATGEAPSRLKKQSASPYDVLLFGMYWERKALTDRIEARTPLLLARGWIEEVRRLKERGYDAASPAMKSHGYREVLSFVEGHRTEDDLLRTINAKTRQYAKRQMTWWKHDPRIHWLQMS